MANDDRVCHYRGQLDPRPFAFGAMALMGLCATVLLGILPIKSALAGFSDPTIWMIAAAFFISRGFISTGFGRRVGYWFISKLGHNSLGLAYGLVLTDLLFAPATKYHSSLWWHHRTTVSFCRRSL